MLVKTDQPSHLYMSNMVDVDQGRIENVLRDVTKSIVRRMDSNGNGPMPELKREVEEVCFLSLKQKLI